MRGKLYAVAAATLILCPITTSAADRSDSPRPNVLFVAIDDLNDWVGCLGGNPQVRTPNLDRFAQEHGLVMSRAYCPSTVCCPSRSALLTGRRASSTGVYGNGQNLKNAPQARAVVTLPEYFGSHGYYTLSAGKIFHKHPTEAGLDEGQWAFEEHAHPGGGNGGIVDKRAPAPVEGVKAGGTEFAWGATGAPLEQTKDYMACKWGADKLDSDFGGKPFFMAIGISKPHLPWYVPQEFFDMYPLEDVQAAEFHRDDLDDVTNEAGRPIFKPGARFILADKSGMHREAARAYLAAASYADACVGVLLSALERSAHGDNTVVMIWGDHGWYLGEKLQYGKTWLWEEAARVPFIVSVPGVTPSGAVCSRVVNLLDMYPTLIELCGLPENGGNEGRSFAALLENPEMAWNYPTLTTYGYKNHSVFDGRYRYTWYGGKADGAEEFYDHQSDPMEWTNLAGDPQYGPILRRLKAYLPEHDEPPAPMNTIDNEQKRALRRAGRTAN